jgi:hypothetical protein
MIELLLFLVIIGAVLYFVPMEPRIKTAAVVILLIFCALYLLGGMGGLRVPRFR